MLLVSCGRCEGCFAVSAILESENRDGGSPLSIRLKTGAKPELVDEEARQINDPKATGLQPRTSFKQESACPPLTVGTLPRF
jgi:hypothetical protein